MAGTTADKLSKLQETKAALKTALAERGQTVGEKFSDYPTAVRAIATGGKTFCFNPMDGKEEFPVTIADGAVTVGLPEGYTWSQTAQFLLVIAERSTSAFLCLRKAAGHLQYVLDNWLEWQATTKPEPDATELTVQVPELTVQNTTMVTGILVMG